MIERIEINLLPAEYRVHARKISVRREYAYPILGVTILLTVLLLWRLNLQSSIADLQDRITALSAEIQKRSAVKERLDQLRSEKTITEEKITALKRIDVNRERWVRLQEVFTRTLPEQSWLEAIVEKNQDPAVIDIRGKTFSFPEVAAYMSSLTETVYIKSVDLADIEQAGKTKAFTFNISCRLNPDAGLPRAEN